MKLIFRLVIPLISSIYLSLITGQHLHFSVTKYVFLGIILFVVLQNLFSVLYNKFLSGQLPDKRMMFISLILSALLLLLGGKYLIPEILPAESAVVVITASGEKNAEAKSSEIWITGITNAGTDYDLNKIVTDSAWEKKPHAFVSLPGKQPAVLNITIKDAIGPAITFTSHPWSGKVRIMDGVKEDTLDLYKAGDNGEVKYEIKHMTQEPAEGSPVRKGLFAAIAFLFFAVIIYLARQIATVSSTSVESAKKSRD